MTVASSEQRLNRHGNRRWRNYFSLSPDSACVSTATSCVTPIAAVTARRARRNHRNSRGRDPIRDSFCAGNLAGYSRASTGWGEAPSTGPIRRRAGAKPVLAHHLRSWIPAIRAAPSRGQFSDNPSWREPLRPRASGALPGIRGARNPCRGASGRNHPRLIWVKSRCRCTQSSPRRLSVLDGFDTVFQRRSGSPRQESRVDGHPMPPP